MSGANWLNDATILVTGATGRVGSMLTRQLMARGARVRTVVFPGDPGAPGLPAEVEVFEGQLSDPEVIERAVAGVDGVAHLAALMDWGPGANDRLFETNVRGTYLLLDRVVDKAPDLKGMVVVSSDEVYPALEVDGEIHEGLPLAPYSFYGLTKQIDEVLADFYHRAHDVPVTVARFALTAAPAEILRADGWSGRLFFAKGLRALMVGLGRDDAVAVIDEAVTEPENTLVLARDMEGASFRFQFCDVHDLVEGIIVLLTADGGRGEAVNLSGPAPVDYADIVPALAAVTGASVVDLRLPGQRFDVHTNIDRARSLGYAPRYDIETILAAATAE